VQNLKKTYVVGDIQVHALRGVSVDVEPGEFVCVTGPSGSGKSTFMHILGCLDRPTAGQYILDGQDVSKMSRDELAKVRNHRIGSSSRVSICSRGRAPSRTSNCRCSTAAITSRVRTGTSARGPPRDRRPARAVAPPPNQLSGGQQQRVAIARALINNPSILLADEPTGNLDSRTSIEVMDVFQRLNVERGITILLITHEHDIAEYGTRTIAFRDGHIVRDAANEHRRMAKDELAALPPPK